MSDKSWTAKEWAKMFLVGGFLLALTGGIFLAVVFG